MSDRFSYYVDEVCDKDFLGTEYLLGYQCFILDDWQEICVSTHSFSKKEDAETFGSNYIKELQN